MLGLEAGRTVLVPGGHDVTRRACEAYFANCEADDVAPLPPYWPKWRHFSRAFDELYRGLDLVVFDRSAPWTLFTVPDLRVAVAGLNSTIADSHRAEDHYGWIGEAQAAWAAAVRGNRLAASRRDRARAGRATRRARPGHAARRRHPDPHARPQAQPAAARAQRGRRARPHASPGTSRPGCRILSPSTSSCALDKAHTVDGLVAAHLANHGEELIDLKAFRYMLRQGRIVLLFDGFDELVTRVNRAADHLQTLLQAAQESAKVVVASRTQHFKSHAQVFTALGERVELLPHRRVIDIAEFTAAQIRAYLVNRYGSEQDADTRIELISGVHDLLGLSRNPRMLSFIADLDSDRLAAVAGTGRAISAAGLYQAILQSWLSYEEERTHGTRGGPEGLRVAGLWRAVTALAMRLWDSGEPYLRLAELTDRPVRRRGDRAGGRRPAVRRADRARRGHEQPADPHRRRPFGFIHSSVTEWLVAREVARLLADDTEPAPLARQPLSQLTVDFLCDMADPRTCQQWVERVLGGADGDPVLRANGLKILTQLRTPARTNLRGALLQGEDLSYRDLRQVDLTDADLTEARLVGTNLGGGTLRGIQAGGSRWTRAALIDVAANPGLAGAPELCGAAFSPGQPVRTEIAPASVSVAYGYDPETARLPEPLAWSPDGSVLAAGCDDGSVLVIDPAAGLPLRSLPGLPPGRAAARER